MRKLLVVFFGIIVLVSGVQAQDDVDVRALARYFPDDTLVYAAIRSDDAYFETLDGLIARVTAVLSEVGLPVWPQPVGEMIAEITNADGSFEETLRPWLGDSIAVGILSLQGFVNRGDTPIIVAFDISDQEALLSFLETNAFPNDDITPREEGGALIFTPDDSRPDQGFAVTEDALIAFLNTPIALLSDDQSLRENETFIETIDQLPESSYNALLYANVPTMLDNGLEIAEARPNRRDMQAVNLIFDLVGAHALGLTVLDNGALVADLVGLPGEMMLPGSSTPISPDFAAAIPANASVVIHGADLRAVYDSTVDSLRAFAIANDQPTEEFDRVLGQIAFVVRGLSGLEFDEFREALSGDFAAFIAYAPTEPGEPSMFGLNFYRDAAIDINIGAGLVLKTPQPDAAETLAVAVANLLEQPDTGVTISDETIAGVEVTVASFTTAPNITSSLDLVIGANEGLLVIATRPEAEAILSGEAGLDSSPTFADAYEVALPDTTFLAYVDTIGVRLFGDTYASSVATDALIRGVFSNITASLDSSRPNTDPNATDKLIEELRQQLTAMQTISKTVSGLFQYGIISGAATEEGGYLLRLALTLN
jgi:hypothetical protein